MLDDREGEAKRKGIWATSKAFVLLFFPPSRLSFLALVSLLLSCIDLASLATLTNQSEQCGKGLEMAERSENRKRKLGSRTSAQLGKRRYQVEWWQICLAAALESLLWSLIPTWRQCIHPLVANLLCLVELREELESSAKGIFSQFRLNLQSSEQTNSIYFYFQKSKALSDSVCVCCKCFHSWFFFSFHYLMTHSSSSRSTRRKKEEEEERRSFNDHVEMKWTVNWIKLIGPLFPAAARPSSFPHLSHSNFFFHISFLQLVLVSSPTSWMPFKLSISRVVWCVSKERAFQCGNADQQISVFNLKGESAKAYTRSRDEGGKEGGKSGIGLDSNPETDQNKSPSQSSLAKTLNQSWSSWQTFGSTSWPSFPCFEFITQFSAKFPPPLARGESKRVWCQILSWSLSFAKREGWRWKHWLQVGVSHTHSVTPNLLRCEGGWGESSFHTIIMVVVVVEQGSQPTKQARIDPLWMMMRNGIIATIANSWLITLWRGSVLPSQSNHTIAWQPCTRETFWLYCTHCVSLLSGRRGRKRLLSI